MSSAKDEVALLRAALSLVPDLRLAVELTSLAIERLKFPVASASEIRLFDNETMSYRGHIVHHHEVESVASTARYPITDAMEFLTHAYVGILTIHQQQRVADPMVLATAQAHIREEAFRE
jgi:hypothetical protein